MADVAEMVVLEIEAVGAVGVLVEVLVLEVAAVAGLAVVEKWK